MLVSLLENCIKNKPCEIAVVNDNISEENITKLETTLFEYSVPIRLIEFESKVFSHLTPKNNKTLAAFHRIFLSEFYSADIEKVLYLDCDIIVRKDISELFNTDISNYITGAIQNDGLYYQKKLGIPEENLFFNSGVMLVNLTMWRKFNIQKKLIDYIENNFELMFRNDQDALNAVLVNDWLTLNPQWNTHLYFFTSPHLCRYDPELLQQILKDPAVVHFTTQNKPWFYIGKHPFKKEYYKYLKLTAWKNYIPADKTFLNIFRKNSNALFEFIYRYYKRSKRSLKKVVYR
jgi:lipopolysaccharide biosynthesis glycosyltransferase